MRTESSMMLYAIYASWVLLGLFLASRTKTPIDNNSLIDLVVDGSAWAATITIFVIAFAPLIAAYRMLNGLFSKH